MFLFIETYLKPVVKRKFMRLSINISFLFWLRNWNSAQNCPPVSTKENMSKYIHSRPALIAWVEKENFASLFLHYIFNLFSAYARN